MITIELMGGLGNQLFQVFALISYAKNNKSSYYIQDKEITFGTEKDFNTLIFSRVRLPLGLGEVFPVIVFLLPKDMAAIREQGFLVAGSKVAQWF